LRHYLEIKEDIEKCRVAPPPSFKTLNWREEKSSDGWPYVFKERSSLDLLTAFDL
jgi:hypothetical protein